MTTKLLRDLFQAYYDARRHKRNSESALAFEVNYEQELFQLYDEIVTRRYTISPSTFFIVKRPVQREIFAGAFRDRVVHHLLYNYLNPLCERAFINDSYGCRVGKGTSYGIARVEHFIRSVSQNYTKDCYVLKLDIKGYFMSINQQILFEKVNTLLNRYQTKIKFSREMVEWLLKQVIFHKHTAHGIRRGPLSDWDNLPPTKSLFHTLPGCGLPIGNLTSQLFGNVYLNDFDHWATSRAGVRYGRYVDDMVFVARSQKTLRALVPVVRERLVHSGELTLHPKKIYLQHQSKGVHFLGMNLRPYRRYPRHRTKANAYRYVSRANAIVYKQRGYLSVRDRETVIASLNSYLGILRLGKTFRLRQQLLSTLSSGLRVYMHTDTVAMKVWSARPKT